MCSSIKAVQTGLDKSLHPLQYLSLWPLLQSLQEWGNIIIIINGELHVLPHNANGNVLKQWEMARILLHLKDDHNILNANWSWAFITFNLNPAQFLRIHLGLLLSAVIKLPILSTKTHLLGEVLDSYLSDNPSLMLWHLQCHLRPRWLISCAGICVAECDIRQEWRELVYLGSEVLLGGEGFSESTEAMLDQIIQITCEQNNT